MSAVRLSDLNIDANTISTEFSHLDHMYSGWFSEYYYRRFDQALDKVEYGQNQTVLEIGGGTGVFLLSLIQSYSDIYFTDISREDPPFSTARKLLESAEKNENNINYTIADTTDLPYRSNSFDSVFILYVLEHVPDERTAISEISRVTAKDGNAIISAPIEIGLPVIVREGYRFIDGNRRHTESIQELWKAITGDPLLEFNEGHRGYDYRQTTEWLLEEFNEVSIEYCPWPELRDLFNPTAIISATM